MNTPFGQATPGTPYFTFTARLQAFYAARGMWIGGKPQGALAAMLGAPTPFGAQGGIVFFVSAEQIGMLSHDIAENGFRGMCGRGVAQALRRLREALARSGTPSMPITPAERRLVDVRPSNAGLRQFEPLIIPSDGKA